MNSSSTYYYSYYDYSDYYYSYYDYSDYDMNSTSSVYYYDDYYYSYYDYSDYYYEDYDYSEWDYSYDSYDYDYDYDYDMEYESEEEWYNYLTMDGTDDYAMIWMEGSDMNTLWVWDPSGATCTLTTDWKTEDMEDGAYGFYVSDPDGACPYVESEDTLWTYAWLESDEEGNPISVTGPYGNEWSSNRDWVTLFIRL